MVKKSVCRVNGGTLGVKVHPNGWCATWNDKDTSLSDIPAQYHGMLKNTVGVVCKENGWPDMGKL